MSLWKSNDTTTVKVNKRYQSNGTTQKQIKKKYKSNGASLELVYSADLQILNGNVYAPETGGFGFNQGAKPSSLEKTGLRIYPIGGFFTNNKIDFTPYKTLEFDVYCAKGGEGGGGLSTYVGYANEKTSAYSSGWVVTVLNKTVRYKITMDIENVNEPKYIIGRCSNYNDQPLYVYSITLY